MFDKDEAIMLYKMVEGTNFQGRDCKKVVAVLQKLDDHIVKCIEKEEKAK